MTTLDRPMLIAVVPGSGGKKDWLIWFTQIKVGNKRGTLYRHATRYSPGGSHWKWRNNVVCAASSTDAIHILRAVQPSPSVTETYLNGEL